MVQTAQNIQTFSLKVSQGIKAYHETHNKYPTVLLLGIQEIAKLRIMFDNANIDKDNDSENPVVFGSFQYDCVTLYAVFRHSHFEFR